MFWRFYVFKNVLENPIQVIRLSVQSAIGYYAGVQNLRMCRHDFRAGGAEQQEGKNPAGG